jgi:hypothetical protein
MIQKTHLVVDDVNKALDEKFLNAFGGHLMFLNIPS